MSIKKCHDRFVPVCDCCGKNLPPEYYWDDAVMATREAGWHYDFAAREHTCPDCQKFLEGFKHEE